jgi:hypothetical protein
LLGRSTVGRRALNADIEVQLLARQPSIAGRQQLRLGYQAGGVAENLFSGLKLARSRRPPLREAIVEQLVGCRFVVPN